MFNELSMSMVECDEPIEQTELEEHLRTTHKVKVTTPEQAISHFVLQRGALMRGPARRKSTKDTTEELFTREDYR